ncbi:MAG: hypothetical protein V7695_04275 [Sulfitobacter sp.]
MTAVAGNDADTVMDAMDDATLTRGYVNNCAGTALHLTKTS